MKFGQRKRQRSGFTLLEFSLYSIVIGILLTVVVSGGTDPRQAPTNLTQHDMLLQLDRSLALWSAAHGGAYPQSLLELQLRGYWPHNRVTNVTAFAYTRNETTYTLSVNIGGQNVQSPLSGRRL